MNEGIGSFCLVLHGHLPWVLHHGRWPHGEDWLFEAAAETWMPLLDVLEACLTEGLKPKWTVGLTPILLEQLAHDRFKVGFAEWLAEYVERAKADEVGFARHSDHHLAALARRHAEHFADYAVKFEAIDRDIPGAIGRHAKLGQIELLSSNATHGYHPLILHDASARAQLRVGLATSERHLGARPEGIWLPECAYRGSGLWKPPIVHGDLRHRMGVAQLCQDEKIGFFFVDTHLVTNGRSEVLLDHGVPTAVTWDQASWDLKRGWRSPLEAFRVCEGGALTNVSVLARNPRVSEQVWSGEVGYPGDSRYLEFHKRHGMRGLRYWRISGEKVGLGDKQPYRPDLVADAVYEQSGHFVNLLREQLWGHHNATGRRGTVCAPFDAELFGHWWSEGPRFLLEVARRLQNDGHVVARTVSEALAENPADKGIAMPEGSWGAGGDHRVWWNDGQKTYWELAYHAEDRFLDLWHRTPWRTDPVVSELLTEAGRQLLLLQASDWPFVVHTQGAVDYGLRRIFDHAGRFDDLCNGVEDWVRLARRDPVAESTLARCRLVDPVFPDLTLNVWG